MANNQGNEKQSGGGERDGSGNFANDPQRASEAGKKGGQQSQGTSESGRQDSGGSQRGGSGNFANDPERASEAGRKGGENSHRGSSNS